MLNNSAIKDYSFDEEELKTVSNKLNESEEADEIFKELSEVMKRVAVFAKILDCNTETSEQIKNKIKKSNKKNKKMKKGKSLKNWEKTKFYQR